MRRSRHNTADCAATYFRSGGVMENGQAIETPIANEALRDGATMATQMRFGWKFEPLPRLKVAKNLAVAITVRRAPGGHIVCWKATAQEIELRDRRGAALQRRRAQKTSEKGTSSNRGAKRTSASTQTTLA